MKSFVLGALVLATAAHADQPSARDLHAAQCVAALEVETEDLAQQVKSGQEARRGPLMDRLTAGTAFVGEAYLRGLPEKQARELANQALEAQKTLSDAELRARQVACAEEGTRLYSASNGLQQAVVKRLAKRRMDKLLGG